MNNNIETIDCSKHLNYCFNEPFKHLNPGGVFKLGRSPLHYRPLCVDIDPDFLRNDWGVIAARAFVALKEREVKPRSCVVIGTGIGLDALALIECFSPTRLVITDLDQQAVEEAKFNILNNVTKNVRERDIKAVGSDLFADDYFRNKKFDLVFENLPNLPYEEVESSDQPIQGSFYKGRPRSTPTEYQTQLLTSHYQCLSAAKYNLSKEGGIICNIGLRIPIEDVLKMFDELGYEVVTIVNDFKCQNEALVNLQAYAEWEKANDIVFDFYPYQETLDLLRGCEYDKIKGLPLALPPNVLQKLDELSVSAREAYARIKMCPEDRMGHFFRSFYAFFNK